MPRPSLRLYCLPYSGASAMVYARWRRKLPEWIEVCPLELPGRGRRFNDPLQTDLPALVNQLAGELQGNLDLTYALFGHSLGALVAFELAHALRRNGLPPASALFASGAPAPAFREYHTELAVEQSDTQLLARLRQLGFFFNDTATTEIYTLSLHDALPICYTLLDHEQPLQRLFAKAAAKGAEFVDRKSTRLNSSHITISYAVFCLKKK